MTLQIDHTLLCYKKKMIVVFDEVTRWRESFKIVCGNHTAQLFISSPGGACSTEKTESVGFFFACASDLCHHFVDLHVAEKYFVVK